MPSAAAAPEKRPRDAAQQSWRTREKLERDLSFYDVEGTGANGRLSAAQIAQYNRDGYVFPVSIFSREEAAANLEYFDRIMAEAEAQGHNNYQVENWMRRCRGMFDLCGSPLSQTGLSGVSLSPRLTMRRCAQGHEPEGARGGRGPAWAGRGLLPLPLLLQAALRRGCEIGHLAPRYGPVAAESHAKLTHAKLTGSLSSCRCVLLAAHAEQVRDAVAGHRRCGR